ncbi:PAS domain-containing protein [Candidatus Omnitrophota bacterium]
MTKKQEKREYTLDGLTDTLKLKFEEVNILNNILELIVYQDTKHRVLWANKAAGDSVQSESNQLIGRYCYEVWHKRNEPCLNCPISKVIKTGEPQKWETEAADGGHWFIRGYPVRDKDGNLVGVIEAAFDIAELKDAEENLLKKAEEATMLNKLSVEREWKMLELKGELESLRERIARLEKKKKNK